MAINRSSPHIVALRSVTERQFGHPLECRSDFSLLSFEIERVTHEHVAENTLRRLWGKMSGYETVYVRTLDVLCHYCGFEHWYDFCENPGKKSACDADNKHLINTENLKVGDRIRIGWLPDRICIIEYRGGQTFKAIDCKNSILQSGDSFECGIMIKHLPLFASNLVHGGELCRQYSIGLESGLTILEKL